MRALSSSTVLRLGPWFLWALLAGATPGPARASERASELGALPYRVVAAAERVFLAIAPADRSALELHTRLEPKTGPQRPIRVWIDDGDHRLDVPVAADGTIRLPASKALHERNPVVSTDQPRHSLNLAVVLQVRLPAKRAAIPTAYLRTAAAQAEAALTRAAREDGEFLRLLVGTEVTGLTVRFKACCAGSLMLADGRTFPADASGQARVTLRALEENPDSELRVSGEIERIVPRLDDAS
jgi:hypothetical protein